jgi:hypothetical protein
VALSVEVLEVWSLLGGSEAPSGGLDEGVEDDVLA